MKIYINQNGQSVGPFSREELQEKVYSGQLARTVSACVEGGTDWASLESVLTGVAPKPPVNLPGVTVSLDQLRDPKEKTALVWLYIASIPAWLLIVLLVVSTMGIILPIAGIVWLMGAFGEMWFAAYLKTNAVRVSAKQLPELHQVVVTSCQKLGMEPPEVYVMQYNLWNAFATKIFGRRMVVLFSGAVDSILLKGDMQQLSWVMGHELGHHWAGHLNFGKKLAKLGAWLVWVELWYSRRRELTCDRVGLYCSGSLRASQLALANLTTGAQMAGRVDAKEMAAQWQEHQGEFFVRYRTLYSSYPQLLARMDHLNKAAQEFGMVR